MSTPREPRVRHLFHEIIADELWVARSLGHAKALWSEAHDAPLEFTTWERVPDKRRVASTAGPTEPKPRTLSAGTWANLFEMGPGRALEDGWRFA